MKKLLGVVAAALLLSAGAASASTITVAITINGHSFYCPLNVSLGNDNSHGVSGNILVAAANSDCAFTGIGLIGKSDISKKFGGPNVATISGYTSYGANQGYSGLELILQLTGGGFQDNNKYSVYGITDGRSAPTFLGKGKYKYTP